MSDDTEKLLLQYLVKNEKPVGNPNAPGSISTAGILILVTILIIIGGIIIYYIFLQSVVPSYAISPFKYGDVIVIKPAVAFQNIDPNKQYLKNDRPLGESYSYPPGVGQFMGDSAAALRFTGDKEDKNSQWVLERYSANGNYDSNQSLLYGLGNRFYLRNNAVPVNNLASRVRYQLANQKPSALCPSVSPAVLGSNTVAENFFQAELIVYFLPTSYPDLYYILFPNCYDGSANFVNNPNTTTSPNNGIATIRPWSPLQGNATRTNTGTSCSSTTLCDSATAGTYNPYTKPGQNSPLFDNVLLMNLLPPGNILPPYPNANVALFKVTTTINA